MTHDEECSLLREEYRIHQAMKRFAACKRRGEGIGIWKKSRKKRKPTITASREIVLPGGEILPVESALDMLCDVDRLTQADLERLTRAVMREVEGKRRT